MNEQGTPRWLSPLVAIWLVWVAACAPATAPNSATAPAPAPAQSASQPAAAQAPRPKTDVTMRLAWFARGYDAPYYVALARGLYDEAGLNVEIKEGQGSVRTLALVDNGQDTFGTLDAGVMLAGADKGIQSRMVFMFNQRSPNALVFFADARHPRPARFAGEVDRHYAGCERNPAAPPLSRCSGAPTRGRQRDQRGRGR